MKQKQPNGEHRRFEQMIEKRPLLALAYMGASRPLPVLVFPWAFITHDNHRLQPARNRKGLIATTEYRTKKAEAATLAALQWGPTAPLHGDVSLVARCYFPDRRRRDAGNYRKLLTDAMTGTVYTDDSQLVCETWRRAGIVPKSEARIEVLLYPDADSCSALSLGPGRV